jgi:hypothetical protein
VIAAMQFDYRTEPYRSALIIAGVLVLLAAVVQLALFRAVLLAVAAGPGAWALLQWRRQGRGVRLQTDCVEIQPSLVGRVRQIPYSTIQGYLTTSRSQLVVAYQKPDKITASTQASHALTDIRPESHRAGPHYGLVVTPAVANPTALAAALAAHAPSSPQPHFTVDDLKAWMRRRRLRNAIIVMLVVLGTPLYFILIGRVIASIQAIGVYTSGR